MKIVGNESLPWRVQAEKAPLVESTAVAGFGDLLKRAIDRTTAADRTSAPSAAIGVSPSSALTADPSIPDRIEGFLDLLDGYCQKLSNPWVSLKGLSSGVQRLEEERDTLSGVLGSLPEGDGLKDILNQALVTAEVEIIRFRRGDYLTA